VFYCATTTTSSQCLAEETSRDLSNVVLLDVRDSMATDLAAQLQQVAARAGADTKQAKGQASLLYDSRTASDLGAEEIYDIAYQGIGTYPFHYAVWHGVSGAKAVTS
jgi:hypothetical protein